MNRRGNFNGVRIRRSAYTWIELLVVVVILAVVLGIGIPALLTARERSRRTACTNNLKMISLTIHNYTQFYRRFPPGAICSTGPIPPQNQYDVWGEAAKTGPDCYGTGFLHRLVPYMQSVSFHKTAKQSVDNGVGLNAGVQGSEGPATTNISYFYCPSRRTTLRPGDSAMMLASWWPGGGTDYGGCVGRHVAYDTSSPSHNVLDAAAPNAIVFEPGGHYQVSNDDASHRWGIFGRVNVSTTYREIKDGTENTIATGELQRVSTTDADHGGMYNLSHDGWAVGGDATGFTTGYGGPAIKINGQPTPLMNNGFFQSPGSDHPGGANFGFADGSVRFLNTSLNPSVFAVLGGFADRTPLNWRGD